MIRASDIGILADDLTGACDVAACFTKVAAPVTVHVTPDIRTAGDESLAVINTQSRLLSVEDCVSVNRSVGRALAGRPIVFLKIDTALRGSVGTEIRGLIEAVGPRPVIVAPALPRIGKTTRNGIQYDCGVPIDQTAYAKDPGNPIRTSSVLDLVNGAGDAECRVCDAETDDDLAEIVEKSLDGSKIIFVGSLGLADALAAKIETTPRAEPNLPTVRRLLIVNGSRYGRTLVQLERVVSLHGAIMVHVDPGESNPADCDWPEDLPLFIACTPRKAGKSPACSPSEHVSRFSRLIVRLIRQHQPDGVVVIGGETAFHLLRQLGVSRLKIHGRKDEVVSYGVVEDGAIEGMVFAAKGGSVGVNDTLVNIVEHLRGERSDNT